MSKALAIKESPLPEIQHEELTMLERAKMRGERNNLLYKEAQIWAASGTVPSAYINKPEACFVAVDMADRMGMSPVFIMQNMYVVKGKPSWSGQACITLINNCGKFDELRFVFVGKSGSESYGCYASAKRRDTGEEVRGTVVTMEMAKGEGWTSNSKWRTMTDQMLQYRAAAFFARIHCPEALMGLTTVEESEDVPRRSTVATELTKSIQKEIGSLKEPSTFTVDEPDYTQLDIEAPIDETEDFPFE